MSGQDKFLDQVTALLPALRAFGRSLCGDPAPGNNPIGGLGLNCGIHEAWDLANLLSGASPDLDAYERRRRPLNIEYVQEQTTANKRRLEEREPAKREARFDELRRMADDPARHNAFLDELATLQSEFEKVQKRAQLRKEQKEQAANRDHREHQSPIVPLRQG